MILYVGPGVSLATSIIVFVILLIVGVSLFVVAWRLLKRGFSKFKKKVDD